MFIIPTPIELLVRWEPDLDHPDGGEWIEFDPEFGQAQVIEEHEAEPGRIGFRGSHQREQRIGFRRE